VSPPVVAVEGVTKTFHVPGPRPWTRGRLVRAVQGVDLVVQPGEVVALVGQSGSGKTTLARLVLGLEEPTTGTIRLDGERWDRLPEARRRRRRAQYQYVPQDALQALDPQQTVLEHVVETLSVLRRLSRAAAIARARAQLEGLGLAHRADALPRHLSGGEQRRVTLARVLALEPRLVVADEPTSGLDPVRRRAVLDALLRSLAPGAACILVTHDMDVATSACHRALVMLAGRIIEEIDPRATRPVHPYGQLLFAPWEHPLPRAPFGGAGCPFVQSCPLAHGELAPTCRELVPALRRVPIDRGSAHRVACHATPSRKGP
jgi:ABC-type glutathione transport system ATPase component